MAAGIKNLGAGQEGKPRHRFALSDGDLWLTGVPATQIQHLVPEGVLYTNVILRLNDYIFNTVNAKRFCYHATSSCLSSPHKMEMEGVPPLQDRPLTV